MGGQDSFRMLEGNWSILGYYAVTSSFRTYISGYYTLPDREYLGVDELS